MDDVILYRKVLIDKFRRLGVVRFDTTHLRCGVNDVFRFLGREKFSDGRSVLKIKLGTRSAKNILISRRLERAEYRGAHQSPMPSDVDTRIFLHRPALQLRWVILP